MSKRCPDCWRADGTHGASCPSHPACPKCGAEMSEPRHTLTGICPTHGIQHAASRDSCAALGDDDYEPLFTTTEANADLIALMRNNLPALLRVVRAGNKLAEVAAQYLDTERGDLDGALDAYRAALTALQGAAE